MPFDEALPIIQQLIFFIGRDDRIMVASYTIQGDSFSAGVPRVWSPTPIRRHGVQLNFDISPDGKRVIMFPQPDAAPPPAPCTRRSC